MPTAGASARDTDNWLQVRPGEVLTCNGCHRPGERTLARTQRPLRRSLGRRTGNGPAFPEHRGGILRRLRRDDGPGPRTHQLRDRLCCPDTEHVDVAYDDVWTDPVAAGRATDATFRLRYADLTTPGADHDGLRHGWRRRLPDHDQLRGAHPPALGQAARDAGRGRRHRAERRHLLTLPLARGADGAPGAGRAARSDRRPSADVPTHFKAYRELLATDAEQESSTATLQDRLVQTGVDPVTGLPSNTVVQQQAHSIA